MSCSVPPVSRRLSLILGVPPGGGGQLPGSSGSLGPRLEFLFCKLALGPRQSGLSSVVFGTDGFCGVWLDGLFVKFSVCMNPVMNYLKNRLGKRPSGHL